MRVHLAVAAAVIAGAVSVGSAVPAAAASADCGIDVTDVTKLGAPTAVACTPPSGATGVPTNARPTITFSRPMDATSITRTSLTLTPAEGGTQVTAVVIYSSATLTATLIPAYPLGYSKTYVAKADSTIRSLDQQPLAAPVRWSFTTTGTPITKRVNSGGPTYFSLSSLASYMADTPVSGSLTTSGGYSRTSGAFVMGTDDPALYVDERYGVFTQNVIVPNGMYDVKLDFAETQGAWPDRRIFSMDILETTGVDLPNLDVAATVGQRRALVKTIPNVLVTLGAIHVRSIAYVGDPILSAVEVIPVVPRVTSTSPATDVSPSSAVGAAFNRAMDPSSISTSTFTLTGPGGTTIPAGVTYDAVTRTATLTPIDALASDSGYTATVDGSVTGSDGIAMGSPFSWAFTTGS